MQKAIYETWPNLEIDLLQILVQQQRYNNCGLETIENFLYLITGYRIDQEDALAIHSVLMEDGVMSGACRGENGYVI